MCNLPNSESKTKPQSTHSRFTIIYALMVCAMRQHCVQRPSVDFVWELPPAVSSPESKISKSEELCKRNQPK